MFPRLRSFVPTLTRRKRFEDSLDAAMYDAMLDDYPLGRPPPPWSTNIKGDDVMGRRRPEAVRAHFVGVRVRGDRPRTQNIEPFVLNTNSGSNACEVPLVST